MTVRRCIMDVNEVYELTLIRTKEGKCPINIFDARNYPFVQDGAAHLYTGPGTRYTQRCESYSVSRLVYPAI